MNANLPFCLLAIACLGLWLRLRALEKGKRLQRLGAAAGRKPFAEALPALVILSLILLALARPYYGSERIKIAGTGRDIMIALDVSNSMLAKDVKPSRLEFARRKIYDLLSLLAQEPLENRVGLILFAGSAQLFCPPTADYAVLKSFTEAISAEALVEGGSDIGDALERAGESFKAGSALRPAVILISDGEDTLNQKEALRAKVQGLRLTVNVLGIGKTEGAPIEVAPGRYVRDRSGNTVISRLNEENLKLVAAAANGVYERAILGDEDLRRILKAGGAQAQKQALQEIIYHRELGPWLLIAALFFAAFYLAMGKRALIFPLLLLAFHACLMEPAAAGAEARGDPHRAWRAYQENNFEEARLEFERYLKENPGDLRALQGLASSYYKSGNYEQAARLFEDLRAKGQNGRQKFDALYNLGNSQYMLSRPEAAVESYESALKLKPDDERVKANLAAARRAVEAKPPEKQENNEEKNKEKENDRTQEQKDAEQSKRKDERNEAQPDSNPNEESSGAKQDQPRGQPENQGSSAGKDNLENEAKSSAREGSSDETAPEKKPPAGQATRLPGQSEAAGGRERNSGAEQQSRESPEASTREPENSGSAEEPQGPGEPAHGNSNSESRELQPAFGADKRRNYDQKSLAKEEAERWLEALPDSPALLYKHKGRRQQLDTW